MWLEKIFLFLLLVSAGVFSTLVFYDLSTSLFFLVFGLFLFVLLLKTNFFSLEPQRIALVEKEIPLFVEVFTTSTDDFLLKLDSARNGFGELSKEIDLVCVNLTKGFSFPQTMQAPWRR